MTCFEGLYVEYGQDAEETIGHMFSDLAGKIIAQFASKTLQSKMELLFECALWDDDYGEKVEKSLEIEGKSVDEYLWDEKMWLRVHLAEHVKQMRADLDTALGHNTVVLTSNVESDIPHIDLIRQTATSVHFHNHESGKKGVMVRYLSPGSSGLLSYDGIETKLDGDSK